MDLNERTIHDVIHPTAIFLPADQEDHPVQNQDSAQTHEPSWEDSQLNPKNRIDSLEPPTPALWKIDGCTALGMQFYAIPLFIEDVPPIRCDVYIDEVATESPLIRTLLDLDVVFHTRDRTRVQQQGISNYVLRALQVWTMSHGLDRTRDIYYDSPFGVRILFRDLPLNVRDVDIEVVANHDLEARQYTVPELAAMWQVTGDQMPPSVDIYKLAFVRQLHDSVCVVRYRKDRAANGCKDGNPEGEDGLWVFKALMNNLKYMYHELRVLLNMPAHPNVVARPSRLVVKKYKLNKKRENVVGFLMPFYSGGGLRDELPLLRMNHRLELKDQVRWARGICSGVLHIRFSANTYYPDMRLDQIVLPANDKRPIILDFEQRGVWVEFGPPEVNAIEYLRVLALDEEETYDCDPEPDGSWPVRKRFADILDRILPSWTDLSVNCGNYDNPPHGYNIPWVCLTPREQEHAEVYMLGRVLWCIFEGMSAPQRAAVWQSYQNEPEFEFPEFRRTPGALRDLITRCTRGQRGQLSAHVVRERSRVVLRDGRAGGGGTEAEIRAVARKFWADEVRWAEEFVLDREKSMGEGTWDENIFGRPTLAEVDAALGEFEAGILKGN